MSLCCNLPLLLEYTEKPTISRFGLRNVGGEKGREKKMTVTRVFPHCSQFVCFAHRVLLASNRESEELPCFVYFQDNALRGLKSRGVSTQHWQMANRPASKVCVLGTYHFFHKNSRITDVQLASISLHFGGVFLHPQHLQMMTKMDPDVLVFELEVQ